MNPIQKVELLRAACCVAAADGEISDDEIRLLERLAAEVGVGKASFEAMMARALRDPDFCNTQFTIFNDHRADCMAALVEIAISNGIISAEEVSVLETLAKNLKVPSDVFSEVIQEAKKIAERPRESR